MEFHTSCNFIHHGIFIGKLDSDTCSGKAAESLAVFHHFGLGRWRASEGQRKSKSSHLRDGDKNMGARSHTRARWGKGGKTRTGFLSLLLWSRFSLSSNQSHKRSAHHRSVHESACMRRKELLNNSCAVAAGGSGAVSSWTMRKICPWRWIWKIYLMS